jgi:hypothetical protein
MRLRRKICGAFVLEDVRGDGATGQIGFILGIFIDFIARQQLLMQSKVQLFPEY